MGRRRTRTEQDLAAQADTAAAYYNAKASQLADPVWRLSHLYCIRTERQGPQPFRPNPEQMEVIKAIYVLGWRILLIPKARQLGMSTLLALICLDSILFYSSIQCSLVDLTAINAKKKLVEKVIFAFDRLPRDLRDTYIVRAKNVQQGEFTLSNAFGPDPTATSTMYADDKQRGGTNQVLWISEWAETAIKLPAKSQEILLGAWPTGEQGVRIVETTWHGGKRGHVWPLVEEALETPEERRDAMTPRVLFFPWWKKESYRRRGAVESDLKPDTVAYFKAKQAAYGIKLSVEQMAWYQQQAHRLGIFVKGQYPTDIDECFEAPVQGAIWAKEIARARTEGRITDVALRRDLEVDTFWDLGAQDNTATLYAQHVAGMRHLIDFDFGEDFILEERVRHMAKKQAAGYRFGTHYLPHDGAHRQKNGISFQDEFARALKTHGVAGRVVGLTVTADKWLSINTATNMLRNVRVDAERCKVWIEAAELYRRKPDKNNERRFLDEVVSDWSCHPADSFRCLAEAALAQHLPFTSNGVMTNTYFDPSYLAEITNQLPGHRPSTWEIDMEGTTRAQLTARRADTGWLRVWETPNPAYRYLISLTNGAMGVWRAHALDPVSNDEKPAFLAAACVAAVGAHASRLIEWAAMAAAYYGHVQIAVDVLGLPGAVEELKKRGCGVVARRQALHDRNVGQEQIQRKPGFEINPEVRLECFAALQQAWRDRQVLLHEETTLAQMGGLIIGEDNAPTLMPGFQENWLKMAALGYWQIGQASPMRRPGGGFGGGPTRNSSVAGSGMLQRNRRLS